MNPVSIRSESTVRRGWLKTNKFESKRKTIKIKRRVDVLAEPEFARRRVGKKRGALVTQEEVYFAHISRARKKMASV